MLLIGSRALIRNGIKLDRVPRDTDYICTDEEFQEHTGFSNSILVENYPISDSKWVQKTDSGSVFEFEIAWPGSTAERLVQIVGKQWYAPLDVLLALKLSHRYLRNSPAFLKTMADIHLLRSHSVVLTDVLKDWLVEREKETYWYQHPNLDRSKADFFTPDVHYVYDHDAVHRAVAHLGRPAYEFYKSDDKEVLCSKTKFFAQPQNVRLYGVLEEAYVLAIERSLVPHPGVKTPRQALEMALMKVCTSITSGWFREFAWENYHQVLALYNDNYWEIFNTAVRAGNVPKAFAPLTQLAE